jgi:dTMP kinase
MAWIAELELRTFSLPPPDLSIYLDTPQDLSRRLIAQKHQRSYTDEAFDANEADAGLQHRVRERYAALAEGQALGRWARVATVADGTLKPPAALAGEVLAAFDAARAG